MGLVIALAVLSGTLALLIRSHRKLSTSMDWLEKHREEIARNMEELEQARNSLLQQKQELEVLNRSKDQWFGVISHDFRHPLTVLQGALQLLRNDDLTEDERNMLIQDLGVRFDRTAKLLDNLLFWAQNQLEGLTLQFSEISMPALFAPVLAVSEGMAERKELNIERFFPRADATIVTDVEALRLIMRNLIDNAIKFTPRGRTIYLQASQTEDNWILQVQDEGIGMPADKVRQFRKNKSIKSQVGTNAEKGSGLGMNLSKDFSNKLGGKLSVASEVGIGTTFTLVLPIVHPEADPSQFLQPSASSFP